MVRVAVANILLLTLVACGDGSGPNLTTGSLETTVTSGGSPADPDGFFVVVDPHTGTPVPTFVEATGGTFTGTGLAPGSHEVELQDVASNCSVSPSALQTVEVTAGRTAKLTYTVTCSADRPVL